MLRFGHADLHQLVADVAQAPPGGPRPVEGPGLFQIGVTADLVRRDIGLGEHVTIMPVAPLFLPRRLHGCRQGDAQRRVSRKILLLMFYFIYISFLDRSASLSSVCIHYTLNMSIYIRM